MVKEKVIIFGASNLGEICYNILKDKYEICFFSDNDKNKIGKKFCGADIINPQYLVDFKKNKIIIASMYYDQISIQLKKMQLEEIYVFTYCDVNDKTYSKRYSLDKICNLNIYKNIKLDNDFKNKFINRFDLIYNKNYYYKYNKSNNIHKNDKKVLIVSYIFPPIGGGGVQRTLKFVKYLKDYGWKPIVLTVDQDFWYDDKDYSLEDDIPNDIEIVRISHDIVSSEQLNHSMVQQLINLYFGVVNNTELMEKYLQYISENDYSNRSNILIPDVCITWINAILKNIESIINFKDIDLIFTTSCPYSDHILGYYLKRKYNNIPWVADFRDEWTNHAYNLNESLKASFKYKIEKEMENSIVNLADKILTVTPICSENYINNFNLLSEKVITLTNGYDENDFGHLDNNLYNKKFTLVFNGSLYKEINPINILVSINELIDTHKIKENLIEINLVGIVDVNIRELLMNKDRYHLIKYLGYLPHKNSLKIASMANILMLILGKSEKVKSVYTGKVFEYLRLYRPILALSPLNSVVDQLLKETSCGKNFEYDDFEGIKKYILDIYYDWLKNDNNFNVNKTEIEKYERKHLTKKLSNIFYVLSEEKG